MHLAFTQLLITPCIGEQVDLLDFPPVCLPSDGQSFAGLDGKVAGKIFQPKPPFLHFLYVDSAQVGA